MNYAVVGNISEVLGFLSAAKEEYQLEGFTINMTSLDDIFMEVTNNDAHSNEAVSWVDETIPTVPSETVPSEYIPDNDVEAVSSQSLNEAAVYMEPPTDPGVQVQTTQE